MFKRSSSHQQSSRQNSQWGTPESVIWALTDVAKLTPVPYLQDAAGVALRIIRMIQDDESNKESFQQLASDAGFLVYIILYNRSRETAEVADFTSAYLDHSKELLKSLQDIYNYIRSPPSRNRLINRFQQQWNASTIQAYRDRLKKFLCCFNLGSGISIQDAFVSVQKQLFHILEDVKRQQEQLAKQQTPTITSEQAGTKSNERVGDVKLTEERDKKEEYPKRRMRSLQADEMEGFRSNSDLSVTDTYQHQGRTPIKTLDQGRGHLAPPISTSDSFNRQHSYHSEQSDRGSPSGFYDPHPHRFHDASLFGIPIGAPGLASPYAGLHSPHTGFESPIPGLHFPLGGFAPVTSVQGAQNTYTNSIITSHTGDAKIYNVSNSNNDSSVRNYGSGM